MFFNRLLLFLLCSVCFLPVMGQELNCRVEINSSQIQGTNTQVFTTLKEAISDYMNNRKWSEAQISVNERLECSMVITVKEVNGDRYKCELQIQSKRPVYNSAYTTTLLNFKDNELEFTYQEFQPLVYNENVMESNLTGVLNFYAFLLLGIDFDSFSLKGGTPFFEKASQFVTLGQSSMEPGWKAFESTRNRHALVSAFSEQVTSPFRQLWYDYHRKGLDEMALSIDKGRAKITSSIKMLDELHKSSPTSVVFPIFSDSKLDELINIYSKAGKEEKEEIYKILTVIFPTEDSRLREIKKESR